MSFCRIKKEIKKIFFRIDLFLYPFYLSYILKRCGVKQIHFSVDDVEYVVKEKSLIVSKEIVDFVEKLKIPATLYLFTQREILEGGFSDYFKVAPHRAEDISRIDLQFFFSSRWIRFHRYSCSRSDVRLWNEQQCCLDGGAIMLCCDDDVRCSYDLSKEETRKLNECYLIRKNGVEYRKTNVRLEKMMLFQLLRLRKTNMLVIFGHNWALSSWSRNFSNFVRICKKNKVEFIS